MITTDKPSREFWLNHIKRWQSSNLSQADYCQQQKLIVYRFGYWKRKLVPSGTAASTRSSSGFARVQIEPTVHQNAGLSLHLPNGFRLQGINSENLTVVGRLLEVLR